MSFLPSDYKSPSGSNNYMKLQLGENKIRILSKPILGWEDWKDNKPVRYKIDKKPAKSIDPNKPLKHFWSLIVWNYAEELIQVLNITQAGVRNPIEALCKDDDWGAPYFYDIKIIKTGEGKETKYSVNPSPHKKITDNIKEAFFEKRCNLDALFDNADPFSQEWDEYTEGIFDESQLNADTVGCISEIEAEKLNQLLNECDPKYKDKVVSTLRDSQGIEDLYKIPVTLFERIYNAALKKKAEFQQDSIFGVA